MSDEMSAEPVAWINPVSMRTMSDAEKKNWEKTWPAQCLEFTTPLYSQSPAIARAMAIAECARVVHDEALLYVGERAALPLTAAAVKIQLLSSPPSVSEEWVWNIANDVSMASPEECATVHLAVRATLAALGVTVEGAAK